MSRKRDITVPNDKPSFQLDAKTIMLIVAVLGGGGGNAYQAWKPEAPSVPLDQYTSVVTVLMQDKMDAVNVADEAKSALRNCESKPGKRERRGRP